MKRANIINETTLGIIILIITLFLAIYYWSQLFSTVESGIPTEICRDSIYKAALLHTKSFDFGSAITCDTENLYINDIQSEEAQHKTRYDIAQTMTSCWSRFGQGKLELFAGSGIYCGICSYIEFKDKTTPLTGLNTYLLTTKMPNNKHTYAEYLSGYTTFTSQQLDKIEENRKQLPDMIDPAVQDLYATIIVYAKGRGEMTQIFMTNLEAAAPGAAGMVAGYGMIKAGILIMSVIPIIGTTTGLTIATAGGILATGSTAYAAVLAYLKNTPYQWYASTWFVPLTKQKLEQLGCTELGISR
ncbi:MAG: hypothetical protein AABX52_03515, partial [Nanoarchaeota archaeon]